MLFRSIHLIPNIDQTYVDLRDKFQTVFDQGRLGSCTANALVSLFNYEVSNNFHGSRLFLYYNERKLDNNISDDCGSTLSSGINALEKYGLCCEHMYPYIINNFNKEPSQDCYIEALEHCVISASNIINDLTIMKQCLINNYCFVVGIAIYESFENFNVVKTGIVPMPLPTEDYYGGHAIVICGFDDSKQHFIGRNSWGKYWGDNGYMYLPYEYITNPYLATDLWIINKII